MSNRKYLGIAIALQLLGMSMAGNILALMGMTSPSHHVLNSVLLWELAEKGHNLTILSVDLPRSTDKVPANVTYIYLERGYDFYKDANNKIDIKNFIGISSYALIEPYYGFGLKMVESISLSKGLQQLLDYPDDFKFDVVINDYSMGPYLMGFVHKFRYPPVIGITPYLNTPVGLDFMSHSYFPALIPYYSTTYSPNMNFLQRLDNTLIFAADTLYRRLYYNPKLDQIMRPFFAPDMPHLSELAKLTKIALINTHPATDHVEPLPQNVIEIGGMQGRPGKPLPTDLDQFMKKGKRGAILFSLGTNMRPNNVDKETKLHIVETFRQLPEYNFVWKFDMEYLKDVQLPKNVLVKDFLPQRDILAHESLILFVSHCGGLSTQEATWHGVPMVGIPLFIDQNRNFLQTMHAGGAVKVDYLTMTNKTLVSAIKEVAGNKSYSKAMKLRSKRLRDTPVPPLDLAVWWVEYLMRHPDPVHLHSTAKDLNYFQTHSLDVLAVLVLIPLLVLFGLVLLCFGRGKQQLKNHHKSD